MEAVGKYVISIMAAAMIYSISMKLLDGKGITLQLGKLLCGLFILLSVLKPFASFQIHTDSMNLSEIYRDAENVISSGEDSARDSLSSIITGQVEAYILDKASQFNAQLQVTVRLSQEDVPTPVGVTVRGSASPYAKKQLQNILEEDLGIKEEDQIWILQS